MTAVALLGDVRPILFAKTPRPGHAKTRLVSDHLDEYAAAAIADAMLRCTVRRLLEATVGVLTLAVTPDADAPAFATRFAADAPRLETVAQGDGDLGARIERVWSARPAGPVALFGMDAPDVPDDLLRAIPHALKSADVAIGPTEDGGYWTLAARRFAPELLRGIEWGGPEVFDQTRVRADAAGLAVQCLPTWRDVDTPADVRALRRRLASDGGGDDARRDLAAALDDACDPDHPTASAQQRI